MRGIQIGGFIVCVGLCFACTPRAHLNDDTGLSLKRVLALQNSVRPQSKLAPISARDAKIIMANHAAGHEKATSRRGSTTSSRGGQTTASGEVSVGERPRATMRRVE